MAPRRYIFLVHSRSGGTWIAKTVGVHPDAFTIGELLNKEKGSYEELASTVDAFWAMDDCQGAAAVCAFRITYHVFKTWDPMRYLAKNQDIGIVFVTRFNKFERAMSLVTTSVLVEGVEGHGKEHAMAFHCQEGEDCAAHDLSVEMDAQDTIQVMTKTIAEDEEARAMLRESALRWREFVYEDIATSGFDSILAFMHLTPGADLHTALVKRIVKSQSEVVSNYDEVAQVIGATPYRWFLDYCFDHVGDARDCTKLPAPAEGKHKKGGKSVGRGQGRLLSSLPRLPEGAALWTQQGRHFAFSASGQVPALVLAVLFLFGMAVWKRIVHRRKLHLASRAAFPLRSTEAC